MTQSRGVDPEVDYGSLKKYGPWDDRNYELTRSDLAYLAPNEEELMIPIPAFFRVLLRKNHPQLPRKGPSQYPRSALQIFLEGHKGYLLDGQIYHGVRVEDDRYVVIEEDGNRYRPPELPALR